MPYLDLDNISDNDIKAAIATANIMALMYFPDDAEMQKSYAVVSLTAMVTRKAKYENFSPAKLPTLLSEFISPFGGFDQLLNSPSYEDINKKAQKKMNEALIAGDILHRISQLNSINPDLETNERMSVNRMVYLIEKQALERVEKLENELESEKNRGLELIKSIENALDLENKLMPRNKLKLVRGSSQDDVTAPKIRPESKEVTAIKKKLTSEKITIKNNQSELEAKIALEKKFILKGRTIEGYWAKYKTVSHLWASNIDMHNSHGGDGNWGGIDILEVPSYHELHDLLSGALHYQKFGQTYCPHQQGQPIFFDTDLWLVPEKLPKPPVVPPPEECWLSRKQVAPAIKFDPDQLRESMTKMLSELFIDFRKNK
jgi:hypothetical protein